MWTQNEQKNKAVKIEYILYIHVRFAFPLTVLMHDFPLLPSFIIKLRIQINMPFIVHDKLHGSRFYSNAHGKYHFEPVWMVNISKQYYALFHNQTSKLDRVFE